MNLCELYYVYVYLSSHVMFFYSQVAVSPSSLHLPWQRWSAGGLCLILGPHREPAQQLNALLQLQVQTY
jgi:hypothetical protein